MEEDGQIKSKLVNIDECIGIIPSLAIHLRDSSSKSAMEVNNETMLPPIIHLTGSYSPFFSPRRRREQKGINPFVPRRLPGVLPLRSPPRGSFLDPGLRTLPLRPQRTFFRSSPNQPARIGGLKREFVMGRGLDNLACSFCALEGFLQADRLQEERNVR